MTTPSPNGRLHDSRTVAAVIAAVQAYLDEEAHDGPPQASAGLSEWKRAPWLMWRGSPAPTTLSWKRGG